MVLTYQFFVPVPFSKFIYGVKFYFSIFWFLGLDLDNIEKITEL
jgi:hypothetical protein